MYRRHPVGRAYWLSPCTGTAPGLEVDVNEIRTKRVEFTNYRADRKKADPKSEVEEIGKQLARGDDTERPVRFHMKYAIIRAVSKEEPAKFSADIFSIDKDAKVGHIDIVRRITTAYLMSRYGYSRGDAHAISLFLSYYNAVHRGDIAYFGVEIQARCHEAHKRAERRHLHEILGLAGRHQDAHSARLKRRRWSRTSSPTKRPSRKSARTTRTSRTARKWPISGRRKLEKDKKELKDEKKELEREKKAIEKEKEDIKKKQEQLEKGKRRNEKNSRAGKAQGERKGNRERRKSSSRKKKKETEKKEEKSKEKEKTIQDKEKKIEKREKSINEEKKQIREGRAEKRHQEEAGRGEEKAGGKGEGAGQARGQAQGEGAGQEHLRGQALLPETQGVPEGGHYNNDLYMINASTRKIMFKSPVENICGSRYDVYSGGIVIITHRGSHTSGHRLTLVDKDTLQAKIYGNDNVFWRSFIEIRDGYIYAVVYDNDRYYLGRFDGSLKLMAKSKEELSENTFISFWDNYIYINRQDKKIIVLNKEDLTFIDEVRP